MWSLFSQDFSDFAKAFKSESASFVDYLGHMAADVVGRGDIYAGDEVLKETTQRMPLPNDLLRRLQEAESTYTLPIQPEEKDAFTIWMKVNPLSSFNAQHRHAETPDDASRKSEGGSSPRKLGAESPPSTSTAMTPNRRSAEWPDEPIDETRQRLLDYNDMLLQRYMDLVGDAVSPRSSIPASPATPDTRHRPVDDVAAAKGGEAVLTEKGEKPPLAPLSPPPSSKATPVAGLRVNEDDFFDRYFFRLTQLRVSEAQRRRDYAAVQDSADVSPLPGFPQRGVKVEDSASSSIQTSPQSHNTQTDAKDVSHQSNDDDDFVAVPFFAKRMMTAASGFVTNIDNALNNAVSAEQSRCSSGGAEFRRFDSEDESANVDPSELGRFRGTNQQIADLESLVQELQEALRQERRRVKQLTAVLQVHNIGIPAELPASTVSTPARGVAAVAVPECHADPTPMSSTHSTAPVGAVQTEAVEATQRSNTGVPTATSTSTPASAEKSSSGDAADARTSPDSVKKRSGIVPAATEDDEDDDDAWVNVNPSAEHSVQ